MLNAIPFRVDIQILRGISVLFVLLFHLAITGFDRGFLGVDVFFVISGYLMATMFDEGTPGKFYMRRIKRLVPAYVVTVVGTLMAASLLTIPVDFAQAAKQALFAAGFVSNIGFWLQSSYFSNQEFSPLLNLWSLGVEMQFYLLIPLLYTFLKPRKHTTLLLLLLAFVASVAMADISPKTAFYHMPFRIWEFLIGAYIAWNPPQKRQVGGLIQSALLIVLLCAILVPMQSHLMFWGMDPGITSFIVCASTGAILAYGMPRRFEQNILGKGLAIVGRYSYALYLVHFPIILLVNYVPFGGTVLGATDSMALVKILSLTAIAAVLMHHLVERQNAFIFKRPILLLAIVVAIATAFTSYQSTRYTAREQNLFAAWTDKSSYRCGNVFRLLHPMASLCELTSDEQLDTGNVLLMGDSHANAIKEAFTKAFSEQGMRVFFTVRNDPLSCDCYNSDRAIADIKRHHITAVVLHYSIEAYDDHLLAQMEQLAAQLAKENIPLRIISPAPNFKYHVPRTLLEQPDLIWDKNLTDYHKEAATFWSRLPTPSIPSRHIIDTGKVFCTPTCKVVDHDHHPYYFDISHLTLTGAALLEPAFERMAKDLAGKR